MAAILSRNSLDGKSVVLPDGLTIREEVRCSAKSCPHSYTLASGEIENRIVDGKNILELMRREAPEVVIEGHPDHSVQTYVWKGPQQGWVF